MLEAVATTAGISAAAGTPQGLLETINHYQIAPGRVFLARYSGCQSSPKSFNPVEFWSVPEGSKLDFDEIRSLDSIDFVSTELATTEREFEGVLGNVYERHKSRPDGFIYVIGAYNRGASRQLRRNVERAMKRISGFPGGAKVKSYYLLSDRISDRGDEELKYPYFVMVNTKDR